MEGKAAETSGWPPSFFRRRFERAGEETVAALTASAYARATPSKQHGCLGAVLIGIGGLLFIFTVAALLGFITGKAKASNADVVVLIAAGVRLARGPRHGSVLP